MHTYLYIYIKYIGRGTWLAEGLCPTTAGLRLRLRCVAKPALGIAFNTYMYRIYL